jgi:peptide/nickel transport system permease protein
MRLVARIVGRRALSALLLVLVAASAALLLVTSAPGDYFSGFEVDPAVAAAERHRLGLDRPLVVQYMRWLGRAVRLDFGESLKYGRPVTQLVAERALNTMLLGCAALLLATIVGIPAGIVTGSRDGPGARALRALSLILLSVPSLVSSFALLLFAATTGLLPVGGFPAPADGGIFETAILRLRYLLLPMTALALPIAASLERQQSRAIAEALDDPVILAARARGLSAERVVWRHALRLAARPVLAVYGLLIGSALSGSFAVEIVMSWPGLGALMYEALVARDLFLVAGCASAGAAFLAAGVFLSDVALVLSDPRVEGGP